MIMTASIYNKVEGHCRRGLHEMTPENTYIQPKSGWKICRACKSEAQKRDRTKNSDKRNAKTKKWREENVERSRELSMRAYKKIQEKILEAKKDKPCADCGQVFPPVCMDFDHLPGTEKKFNIGAVRSLQALEEEMAKCELVCANCHRIRTWITRRETSSYLEPSKTELDIITDLENQQPIWTGTGR